MTNLSNNYPFDIDDKLDSPSDLLDDLGNLYLKFTDKWRGDCYLTKDLTFSSNRDNAAKFYLLKVSGSPETTIVNGDIVTINSANQILSITDNGLKLISRSHITDRIQNFKITTGMIDNNIISFESPVSFLLNVTNDSVALKYDNTVDLSTHRSTGNVPRLTISPVIDSSENFEFSFERSDSPVLTSHLYKTSDISSPEKIHRPDYKNLILLCSLMLLLFTCIMISTKIK